MTKLELRRTYLDKRRALSPKEVAGKSLKITKKFFADLDLGGIGTLHCFLSIEKLNEVDTSGIIGTIWSEMPEVQVAVPKINSVTGELESFLYTPETELSESSWGIREPVAAAAVDPSKIGMVIVPGLVCDMSGHRVGYGKGFYDRFLAQCRPECVTVGLSLFPPVERIGDVHAGDVSLDICITPEAVYKRDPVTRTMSIADLPTGRNRLAR